MIGEDTGTRLDAAVETGFDEQVRFTGDLVRLPSLRGREATAQNFIGRALATRGFAVDRWQIRNEHIRDLPGLDGYDDAWVSVGTLRSSTPGGRSLIINGHIDVVPEGPHDMWSTPPFEPVVKDGWMHGRGAGDMKAGWVCGLFALDAIRRAGFRPASDITIEAMLADSHRHVFGERVNLDSCRQVTRAIARFIADWCGLEPL